MKSKYFDGLDQVKSAHLDLVCRQLGSKVYCCSNIHFVYCYDCLLTFVYVIQLVRVCIAQRFYDYLALLDKYCDKNKKTINKSVNVVRNNSNHPLIEILKFDDIDMRQKWVELYLSLCLKSDAKIEKKIQERAIEMCEIDGKTDEGLLKHVKQSFEKMNQ